MSFSESADGLGVRELERRLSSARSEIFGRGRTIVFRGEILCKVYVVRRGRVRASYETALGPTALELKPGDFFGEIGVLEGLASDALVESDAARTVVLGVPVESFRALLASEEALMRSFLERIAERRTALGAALLGWRSFDPGRARASLWLT